MRRLVLLALLSACRREPGASPVPPAPAAEPARAPGLEPIGEEPPAPVVYGESIYALEATLTGDDGRPLALDAMRGHPVLIAMFYATCKSACPMLVSDLRALEARLDEATRADVRVLLVSFDPARDRPPVLARLRAEHGLDARWRLAVTRDEDQARELAAVLGVRYRRVPGGEFYHSSVITLLDGEGRIQARIDGLRRDPAPILGKLRRP